VILANGRSTNAGNRTHFFGIMHFDTDMADIKPLVYRPQELKQLWMY